MITAPPIPVVEFLRGGLTVLNCITAALRVYTEGANRRIVAAVFAILTTAVFVLLATRLDEVRYKNAGGQIVEVKFGGR